MPRYFATDEERKYFRDYRRNKYQNDPEEKARIKKRMQERLQGIRDWYRSLKDNQPCADCGVKYIWYKLDYDHLGDDKEKAVSRLVALRCSKERILKEIAKCELVCANCHRERTYNRANPSLA